MLLAFCFLSSVQLTHFVSFLAMASLPPHAHPCIICFLTHSCAPATPLPSVKPHPSLTYCLGFPILLLQRICHPLPFLLTHRLEPSPTTPRKIPKLPLHPYLLQETHHMSPWLKPPKLRDPCFPMWGLLRAGSPRSPCLLSISQEKSAPELRVTKAKGTEAKAPGPFL